MYVYPSAPVFIEVTMTFTCQAALPPPSQNVQQRAAEAWKGEMRAKKGAIMSGPLRPDTRLLTCLPFGVFSFRSTHFRRDLQDANHRR